MLTFITIVHVLLCVFMIFVILLQPGKDAGMGAALGGGAASSAFGGRGAVTILTKITGVVALLFFLSSLGLSFVGLRSSVAKTESVAAPATSGAQQPIDQRKADAVESGKPDANSAPVTEKPAPVSPTDVPEGSSQNPAAPADKPAGGNP